MHAYEMDGMTVVMICRTNLAIDERDGNQYDGIGLEED